MDQDHVTVGFSESLNKISLPGNYDEIRVKTETIISLSLVGTVPTDETMKEVLKEIYVHNVTMLMSR